MGLALIYYNLSILASSNEKPSHKQYYINNLIKTTPYYMFIF